MTLKRFQLTDLVLAADAERALKVKELEIQELRVSYWMERVKTAPSPIDPLSAEVCKESARQCEIVAANLRRELFSE